jgi:uroporphyrinogen-III synthase
MAVLVTRPHPENEATAAALRARGFEALLAPVLRFEPLAFHDEDEATYDAIIVTSANALRAIEGQSAQAGLLQLPLFAVGDQTAEAARRSGFSKVISAGGDAAALWDIVLASAKAKRLKKGATLLYLAGADLARDLERELGGHGFTVVTATTYRMVAISRLLEQVGEAFTANRVQAVLHYSLRSARAFLDAVRADGFEVSALAVPQCCISANVAACLREAGASRVQVAASPDENALLAALERALRSTMA